MLRPAACVFLAAVALNAGQAQAAETAAFYEAYWAGMPAGQIRLTLSDEPASYRSEIAIRSEGLPRLVTRFKGMASGAGALVDTRPVPARYDAAYDLRKRRDRHLSMRFARVPAGLRAERGPDDTSRKPPLADGFRTNVLDPLSALAAIRSELRRGNRGAFSVPVYDGARRFDVQVQVKPKHAGDSVLHLDLTLVPIAGFRGETSDDGDPDSSSRPVALTLSDDQRLMPISMTVPLYFMPLTVQLTRVCAPAQPCAW